MPNTAPRGVEGAVTSASPSFTAIVNLMDLTVPRVTLIHQWDSRYVGIGTMDSPWQGVPLR